MDGTGSSRAPLLSDDALSLLEDARSLVEDARSILRHAVERKLSGRPLLAGIAPRV